MQKAISSPSLRHYRYLILLAMLNACVLSASTSLGYKLTALFGVHLYGTTLIFPLTYLLGDVIAEVYGYRISKIIIWQSMICCLVTAALVSIIVYIPGPSDWHHQDAYLSTLGSSLRIAAASAIGVLSGALVNAYAISKWKVLLNGRYFWLRSIGASGIGEAILTIVSVLIGFIGRSNLHDISYIIISAYIFKLSCSVIAAYPATLLVAFLKKHEEIDAYDKNIDFNPFKLNSHKNEG
jgi:uncharacterized integral membrane protein (TIGR00697 family)